jgi:enhancing lycopene biosynthesis protein 2
MAAPRVGVVLSGCGFRDGAEVHESVLTLLALDRAGADVRCFAPNVDQTVVVNHLTGETVKERRNVLVESARIARGRVQDVKEAKAKDLDALVLPGGFGAALNLSSFGTKGAACEVHPEVARLLKEMHAAKKPIGAICIAPAVVAKALGSAHPRLTIGDDAGTAKAIVSCGAVHEDCPVDRFVTDRENRIVSTPAYMLGPSIRHVAEGIERCVAEVLAMAGGKTPAAAGAR